MSKDLERIAKKAAASDAVGVIHRTTDTYETLGLDGEWHVDGVEVFYTANRVEFNALNEVEDALDGEAAYA